MTGIMIKSADVRIRVNAIQGIAGSRQSKPYRKTISPKVRSISCVPPRQQRHTQHTPN